MKKAYILLYNNNIGNKEYVKSILNSMKSVNTWRTDMPNSFYLISESDANTLCDEFRALNTNKGRFMIMEVSDNRQGLMPKDTWYLLRHKFLNKNK